MGRGARPPRLRALDRPIKARPSVRRTFTTSLCLDGADLRDLHPSTSNMTQPLTPMELEAAMVAVYRGPLEAFVSRRDALVKELRAAKRREDADRVKLLRKPSRMAWLLDNILDEDGASIEQLTAAIRDAQRGTDLRTAMETVKEAVRAVAAAGARVAIRAGQPIEANTIATAVHAVIGDAGALEALRAGRLVE